MKTRVNAGSMNPMEMKNMSSMMGIMNNIQKIGKGNRKFKITLDKADKKFLSRFIDEVKKQFTSTDGTQQYKGVYDFLNYVQNLCNIKETKEIKLSYEELDFLKRLLSDAVKGMEGLNFKWYQLIKKYTVKLLLGQYKTLLKNFK